MGEMTAERFESAPTFDAFLEGVEEFRDLWHAVASRTKVDPEIVAEFEALPSSWNLVGIAEDWCFDAINPMPVLAKLAEETSNIEFRVLLRDQNLDIMDQHLTNGRSRSIPIVVLYDAGFGDRGCWGSRPRELQEWMDTVAPTLPKEEKSKYHRRWYARDKGVSTLREILEMLRAAS